LRFKRHLQPQAGKMENAEWSGNSGANHWNVCIGHNSFGNTRVNELQVRALKNVCNVRSAASFIVILSEAKNLGSVLDALRKPEQSEMFRSLNMTAIC
jgi:hypothetical protein